LFSHRSHPDPHACPTRRSSDLGHADAAWLPRLALAAVWLLPLVVWPGLERPFSTPKTALLAVASLVLLAGRRLTVAAGYGAHRRSEEHTSELQSRENIVCRLLL